MRPAGAGGAHLTYCTNIHRGETWAETFGAIERHLPAVKRAVAPAEPMGVGLRLSAIAAEELGRREELERFEDFLKREGLYVFTINGFPFGPFHGVRVKEQVYQPDWRFPERLAYSDRLAELLAELLPDEPGLDGSVSTVPGTFRPVGSAPGAIEAIVGNLMRHVVHLARLRETTGRTITLALEPEPMCLLETTAEAVAFLQAQFLSNRGVAAFARMAGLAAPAAETALRRHLGLCYDVCHAAVEFEDAVEGFASLEAAGVGAFKVQLSAALKAPAVDATTIPDLARFDDGVYLHQVVERRGGQIVRYLDLAQAFAAAAEARGSEWRVHCHVPVFVDTLPRLATTQDMLREVLALHRTSPLSQHLEVETYTFDVLPEELRNVDVATAVAREIEWVKNELRP